MGRVVRIGVIGIVGLILVILAGLFIVGGGDGRWRHTETISIDATPERIFPWLTEPEKLMAWLGGLVESTPITRDGLKVGARSREVVEQGGERFEMESIISELNPPGLITVRVTGESFESVVRYELRGRDGVTEVTYYSDTQFDGLLFRMLEPLIGMSAEEKIRTDLARLKERVESTAAASPEGEADNEAAGE